MTDVTSFFQFGQSTNYVFYALEQFLITKVKSYDNSLYWEYFTLDTQQGQVTRQVMGFFLVCANVGGMQQVFMVLSAFFFCMYSNISFKTEEFYSFFNIITDD